MSFPVFPPVVSWQEIHFLHIDWRNLVKSEVSDNLKEIIFSVKYKLKEEVSILNSEGCQTFILSYMY